MISRAAVRLRNLPSSTSPSDTLRNLSRLSSSWSPDATAPAASAAAAPDAATTPMRRDESDDGEKSAAYCQSRKFARPVTVTWTERLHNSINFIGTVKNLPKQCTGNEGMIGAHTVLLVKTSPESNHHFSILLSMWGLLAEQALAHLKPNDFIYVSGRLGSYTKPTFVATEKVDYKYKVSVNELNYVQVPEGNCQVLAKSGSEAGESGEERHRSRLILWQLLFANPDQWYDNRKTKKSRTYPDFKNKSTGEALWLNANDPAWLKKQVQSLDSRFAGGRSGDKPVMSSSDWIDEELSVSRYSKQLLTTSPLTNGIM